MEKLRSESGCPWDKVQTRASLKPYIIEEAYELIEAIEANDPGTMVQTKADELDYVRGHFLSGGSAHAD